MFRVCGVSVCGTRQKADPRGNLAESAGPCQPSAREWRARMRWMSPGFRATSQRQRPNPPWALTALTHSSRYFRLVRSWSLSRPFVSSTSMSPDFEPDDEVGTVLPHHTLMYVEHLEAEMVVLDPGVHLRGVVQREGVGRFPSAVEDAEVDVAAGGGRARLSRKPSAHVAGGADRLVPVEDRLDPRGVFVPDGFPDVLHHLGHVQRCLL